jgi:hypothetical protein
MNDTAEKMGHTGAVQRTYLKADASAEGGSQEVTIPTTPV